MNEGNDVYSLAGDRDGGKISSSADLYDGSCRGEGFEGVMGGGALEWVCYSIGRLHGFIFGELKLFRLFLLNLSLV